jgi:hypothetical protein
VKRFVTQVCEGSAFDFEAVEFGLRATVLLAGAGLLQQMIKERFGSARALAPSSAPAGRGCAILDLERSA